MHVVLIFSDYFCLFRNLNLAIFVHFDNVSEWTVGTLCAQLLLKFQANFFLWTWSEDVHVIWI